MKKIYISGPMSRLERSEYLARFAKAETLLTERGYRVVNPCKFLICRWPWLFRLVGYNFSLCYDLWQISRCDCIYLLPGWKESKGANIESFFAWNMGVYRLTEKERKAVDVKMAKWLRKRESGEVPTPTHVLTPERKQ
mgnify:CR=1 FL=1